MIRAGILEAFEKHNLRPPAGFEPKRLSCAYCGDRNDQLDVTDANLPPWKIEDWLKKHASCESRHGHPGW